MDERSTTRSQEPPEHEKGQSEQALGTVPGNARKLRSWMMFPLALLLVVVAFAIVGIVGMLNGEAPSEDSAEPMGELAAPKDRITATQPEVEAVDNPIDFATLQAGNSDIYAWLSIPNALIEAPVMQSPTDDWYYLSHDANKQPYEPGAIYTEMANRKDFSDWVTVIYGHTVLEGVVFAPLHAFEDPEFFEANEFFTIYTTDRRLTYRVVSAFEFDDRHILNSYDFADRKVRDAYHAMLLNPDSQIRNVREGATIAPDDKIVQLSTCMTDQSITDSRFVVTGVLVESVPTK